MEVDEQVERLVRHTHVRNEDGSFRQLGRVMIGSVPKGTQHDWLKIVGPVANHVQEVCAIDKLLPRVSTGKWRRKIVSVWPSQGDHVEVFKVASLISSVLLLVQLWSVSFLWVIRTVLWTTMLLWCLCLNLVWFLFNPGISQRCLSQRYEAFRCTSSNNTL